MQEAGVPVGAVLTPEELLDDRQLLFRDFFSPVPATAGGSLRVPAAVPILLNGKRAWKARTAGPALGGHSAEVAHGLGYETAEIAALFEGEVLF